jgi:uncharacterized protein with HEPN domain
LEIIGEAVKRLPEELCQRYPDIPWKGMAGMRDRIINGYDNMVSNPEFDLMVDQHTIDRWQVSWDYNTVVDDRLDFIRIIKN